MNWYETRNHIWAITEYCPGGDLMSLIEADSTGLNEQTTQQFIKELAAGLMYLHHRGISKLYNIV
jgi:serine/threonine-protein kinase ULK4